MAKSKKGKPVAVQSQSTLSSTGHTSTIPISTNVQLESSMSDRDTLDMHADVASTRIKVKAALDSMQELLISLDRKLALLDEKQRQIHEAEIAMKSNSEKADSIIKLNVRGKVFESYKETLIKKPGTYFYAMLSSGVWLPNPDGTYFIDRSFEGFERILDYLASGTLSYEGLTEYEKECIEDNLDYFQIEVPRDEIHYITSQPLPFHASQVVELNDGRLCGGADDGIMNLWNMETGVCEKTYEGHEEVVQCVIQLSDGRICSASDDCSIKLWDVLSGVCERSIEGHAHVVKAVIQLSDGRLCSCSYDYTIKVWSLTTGVCELTCTGHEEYILSIVQLRDGRLCSGSSDYTIKLWNLVTGLCERTLEGHLDSATSIVELHNGSICSGSYDTTIKVWNAITGHVEMSFQGHTQSVNCVLQLEDGRICSGSDDSTIKLWSISTGECKATLRGNDFGVYRIIQLTDGRLVSADEEDRLLVWSS